MNGFCSTCGSWVSGGEDARDASGELLRDDLGNRVRDMDCGHRITVDEPDDDGLPEVDGRHSTGLRAGT
jgi:hypothetical protein